MEKEPGEIAQQRIDKWLFFTRMAKSRGFAQALIAAGAIRVNGQPAGRPAVPSASATGSRSCSSAGMWC